MKDVTLKRVEAFEVTASGNELGTDIFLVGYFYSKDMANLASKNAGAWGQDGKVTTKQMLQDSNGNLYSANSLGRFKDLDDALRQKICDSIKAKLTPEEWKFYESQIKSK